MNKSNNIKDTRHDCKVETLPEGYWEKRQAAREKYVSYLESIGGESFDDDAGPRGWITGKREDGVV